MGSKFVLCYACSIMHFLLTVFKFLSSLLFIKTSPGMSGHSWLCISSDSLKHPLPLSEAPLLHYIQIFTTERVKGPV